MNPKKRNKTPLLLNTWAGAVLAGGESQRFGANKLLLPLPNGKLLCQQVGDSLRPHCEALFCLSNSLPLRGFVRLDDWQAQKGPMAGVMSALDAMNSEWLLVVGGDMPWVTPELVEWFQRQMVPESTRPWCGLSTGGLEPLFSAWPRSITPRVSELWEKGIRSPRSILRALSVRPCMPPSHLGGVKIVHPLRSINRPEDWDSLLLEWKPSSQPPQPAD
jgi:molybdopterin-guanine dinucleotide biosynthesis protein A